MLSASSVRIDVAGESSRTSTTVPSVTPGWRSKKLVRADMTDKHKRSARAYRTTPRGTTPPMREKAGTAPRTGPWGTKSNRR